MANRSTIAFCSVVVIGVLVAATVLWSEDSADDKRTPGGLPPGRKILSSPKGPPAASPTPGYLTNALCKEGWPQATAAEVERYTEETWEPPTQEWAERYPTVVPLLCGLGKIKPAMTLLARRPECALLLAGSAHPDRLATVLDGLSDESKYRVVEGWFKHYTATDDAGLLLEALEAHERVLLELWEKQLYGTEMLFMFPRGTPAAEAYDRWLTEVVESQILPGGHLADDRATLLSFLVCQGTDIRKRMVDAAFAHKFRESLWPKFVKLAGPDLWDAYAAMPGVWKVLELNDGVELMTKFYQLPVLLLASPEAFPEQYHEFILQALRDGLKGDKTETLTLLMCLEVCRAEPDFHKLLNRRTNLADATFRGICTKLAATTGETGDDTAGVLARRNLLSEIAAKSEDALRLDFGGVEDPWIVTIIPGYDVYSLVQKLAVGSDVAAEDVIAAIADGASLIPTGKVANKAVNEAAGEQATRLLAKEGRVVGKDVLTRTSERYSKQVVRNTKSVTTRSVLVSNSLKAAVKTPLRDLVKLVQGVDMTALFRVMADQSGIGLSSVRYLMPWGARFLVHEGGRVFVSISNQTARDLVGHLAESLAHDAVRKLLSDDTKPAELDRAWRRNAYAWWAAHLIKHVKPTK